MVALGCGNESVVRSATNPAEGIYAYLRDLVADVGMGNRDMVAVVSAACDAYADGYRRRQDGGDSFTFDQYIASLFEANGRLDQARVDRAVTDACDSFEGDVRRFVEDLSGSLDIDLDELRNYLAIACAGFEQRVQANADDPYAPEVFDPVVSDVAAKGGLDRSDLSALVNSTCQGLPPPNPASTSLPPRPAASIPTHATAVAEKRGD
jgi:hypothetical protein